MRKIISCENELKIAVERPFYIWGAGDGTRCLLKLLAEMNCQPLGILVTSKSSNSDADMGVEIFEKGAYESGANIIVAVQETIQEEIEAEVKQMECKNVFYISDTFRKYLFFKYYNSGVDLWNKMRCLSEEVQNNFNNSLRFVVPPRVPYVAVGIVDHCNLKCKGCTSFSCIADDYIVPAVKVCADIEQLGKIFENKRIDRFGIMGGEPLLHPDLTQITECVRHNFPEAEVQIVTNGILLLQQDNYFWDVCSRNRITIVCTKYPIHLDFEKIEKKAAEEHVDFQYYGNTGEVTKTLFKRKLDLKGMVDPVYAFATCWEANACSFLMEGKWFECPFICFAERVFNQKFNQHIKIEEEDYLDIYQIEDYHEILEYMAKPKDACRYCKGFHERFPWSRTEGQMDEWI